MKNKIFKILLCFVLLPVFLLTGCGDKSSYTYTIQSSSTYGTVSGTGFKNGMSSIQNGKEVTIKATAHQDSKFLAWIYQGKEIVSREATYTFKAKSKNAGTYIALFEEDKILYVTLTGIDFQMVETENLDTSDPNISVKVSVGENVNTYKEIYSNSASVSVEEGKTTNFPVSITDVIKLSSKTPTNESSYLYRVSIGGLVIDNYTETLYYSDTTIGNEIVYNFETGSYTVTHEILDDDDVTVAKLSLTFSVVNETLLDVIFPKEK
ncbi:MAG: hypothetical protein IJ008_02665 [Clostridia bacterium]|nr:hypothetical protein [Clostridia bacterium]